MRAKMITVLVICLLTIVMGINQKDSEWMTNAPNSAVCLKEIAGEKTDLDASKMPCLLVCLGTKAEWINPSTFVINLNAFKSWIRNTAMPDKEKEVFINGAPFCLTSGTDFGDKCAAGKAIQECLRRVV